MKKDPKRMKGKQSKLLIVLLSLKAMFKLCQGTKDNRILKTKIKNIINQKKK